MKILVMILAIIVIVPIAVLLSGWMVMLASGALGHVFGVNALFLSFGKSIIVSLSLSVIGSFFRGITTSKK